jgi:hypothetical protein
MNKKPSGQHGLISNPDKSGLLIAGTVGGNLLID